MTSKRINHALITGLLGALSLGVASLQAQNVGDWETQPGLASGYWDNSHNDSGGSDNTWQQWDGSEWNPQNGKTDGVNYPDQNTGYITILSPTIITNAGSSGSIITVGGVVVDAGASLQIYKSTFTVAHTEPIDLDIFGTLGLQDSSSGGISLSSGATVVVENGGSITNFCSTTGDAFTGPGYTNNPGVPVPGSITFKNGSMYVQTGAANKDGTIPLATWQTGSLCLITNSVANDFLFLGVANQTFYDFTYTAPLQTAKAGGASNEGSFTVNHNFTIANNNGQVFEDTPGPGYTLAIGGNLSVTNAIWYPSASPGVTTLNIGGNLIVDSTATIGINSGTGTGNVNFDGSSPQTLGIYGKNSSTGSWNWTVNSGSTVNLDSALVVNGGPANTGGALNVNGTLALTANGALSGTSNVITVAHSGNLNVASGTFSLGAEDTLQGSGTVTGSVTAGSTSVVHPGTGAALTFNGSLTYGSATSTNIFNLTSSTSGANDQIVVNGGTLTANNAQIVINSAGNLAAANYVLFNVTGGGNISSATTFNPTPAWIGTTPANASDYSVVTSGNQVLLQYGAQTPAPTISSVSISGTSLTVSGNNGVAGTYTVLMTTDLTANLSTWTPVGSFTLTSGGSFSKTISGAVTPSDKQQFFALKAP